MNCLRKRTNLEIHLIFYLFFTVIVCTSIVSFVIYKLSKCKTCEKRTDFLNTTQVVIIERNADELDLNYQPFALNTEINSKIIKSRNSVEILRRTLNIPCILVGVSINGTDLWAEGIGYSDVENGVKCHKHSVFSVGSISKAITSLLIGQLIDSGKVDLDTNINQYISLEVNPEIQHLNQTLNITLRQLMSERAGLLPKLLVDYQSGHKYNQNIAQTIAMFANQSLISVPGLEFHESDLSWNLIGSIIESVLKQRFDKTINTLMNERLDMQSSGADTEHSLVGYRVRYYRKSDLSHELENWQSSHDLWQTSIEHWWPSVGIISTVSDLLAFGNQVNKIHGQKSEICLLNKVTGDCRGYFPRFYYDSNKAMCSEFIYSGCKGNDNNFEKYADCLQMCAQTEKNSVINSTTFEQFISSQTQQQANDQNIKNGLGWKLFDNVIKNTSLVFGQSQQTSGATNLLLINPENRFVITLFANLGGIEKQMQELANIIANVFLHSIHDQDKIDVGDAKLVKVN